MKLALSFVSGSLFGIGLIVSEMVNPRVVQGFLNITGQWNPQLLGVMGGAVLVNLLGITLIMKKGKPLLSEFFDLPSLTKIDKNIVIGSSLFGIGWGLAGVCPGPALVNIVSGDPKIIVFIASMVFGMLVHYFVFEKHK